MAIPWRLYPELLPQCLQVCWGHGVVEEKGWDGRRREGEREGRGCGEEEVVAVLMAAAVAVGLEEGLVWCGCLSVYAHVQG